MPERVALSRITIGEGPKGTDRRMVMPGERFTVDTAQAAEIDSYDPPIAVDPRAIDAEARLSADSAEADSVRQVAEPDRPSPPAARPAGGNGGGNTTREQPPADDKGDL